MFLENNVNPKNNWLIEVYCGSMSSEKTEELNQKTQKSPVRQAKSWNIQASVNTRATMKNGRFPMMAMKLDLRVPAAAKY